MNEVVKQIDAKLAVPLGEFQREGVRKLASSITLHDSKSPERKQLTELLFSHVHHTSSAVTAEACQCICNFVNSGVVEYKVAFQGLLVAASVKDLSSSAFRCIVAAVRQLLVSRVEKEGSANYSLQSTSHPMNSLLATRSEEW
jgi:hypothetical protein